MSKVLASPLESLAHKCKVTSELYRMHLASFGFIEPKHFHDYDFVARNFYVCSHIVCWHTKVSEGFLPPEYPYLKNCKK